MAIPAITPGGGAGSGSIQPVPPASGQGSTASYGYGANAGAGAGAGAFGPATIVNLSPEAQKALARLTGMDIAAAPNARALETMLKALPDRALRDAVARASARPPESGGQPPPPADTPRPSQPTPEQVRHLVQFLVEQDRRLNPEAAPATDRRPANPYQRQGPGGAAEDRLPAAPARPPAFHIDADAHGVTIFQGSKDITAAVLSGALSTQAQAVLLSALPAGLARRLGARPSRRRGRSQRWQTMLMACGIALTVLLFLTLR